MVKNDLIKVTRYLCPFCLKYFKIRRHFCWRDPRNKSCASCIYCTEQDGIWFCYDYGQSMQDVIKYHPDDVDVRPPRHFGSLRIVNCSHHKPPYIITAILEEHHKNRE